MNHILILLGIVAILCVLMGHISEKLPIPSLLLFLVLGMLFFLLSVIIHYLQVK